MTAISTLETVAPRSARSTTVSVAPVRRAFAPPPVAMGSWSSAKLATTATSALATAARTSARRKPAFNASAHRASASRRAATAFRPRTKTATIPISWPATAARTPVTRIRLSVQRRAEHLHVDLRRRLSGIERRLRRRQHERQRRLFGKLHGRRWLYLPGYSERLPAGLKACAAAVAWLTDPAAASGCAAVGHIAATAHTHGVAWPIDVVPPGL